MFASRTDCEESNEAGLRLTKRLTLGEHVCWQKIMNNASESRYARASCRFQGIQPGTDSRNQSAPLCPAQIKGT